VFVSHTHIDHFIGFDRLLRVCFGRDKTLGLYGPANFIRNVEGKLAGFTWNLVDKYEESITIEAIEVREDHLKKARFRAIDKFARSGESVAPFVDNMLLDEPSFAIRAAILEHRVPCLGFTLEEKFHVNIRKERLEARGFQHGAWLNHLKDCIYAGQPDHLSIPVPAGGNGSAAIREFSLGELKNDLAIISPGQKIAYVTDTVFNAENNERIVNLIRGADYFFCESPFLAGEEERARERRHLTSRQAGTLARMAGVKNLHPFHFSARHGEREEQLRKEAEEAFNG
jgi:ribonuclease Z